VDPVEPETSQTMQLLDRIRGGDREAVNELLALHRQRLHRFIEVRLDPQLRGRVDASDVVQEAQIELTRRMDDFLERQPMPFHVWLCKTAYENLIRLRRQHLGAERRAVGRETALPDHSSVDLAQKILAGKAPGPSEQLLDRELARRVREALAQLEATDQEVLLLRYFDGLDNKEVAQVLGLDASAASKRYGRALLRLRKFLQEYGVSESDA
jgi:RNA polymerase sigma-70 factor, ECF subfamily